MLSDLNGSWLTNSELSFFVQYKLHAATLSRTNSTAAYVAMLFSILKSWAESHREENLNEKVPNAV